MTILADPYAGLPSIAEQATAGATPERPEEFWRSRRTLATIRDVARQRLVSPWAVLGAVLAHVCTRVGPHVVLPPIVGSIASLNTFVAMVGPSGAGKDAALAVAHELLWLDDDVPTHEVGTGQGIDSAFTVQTKDGPVQFCDSALFTITEIDTLTGHSRMAGSTVMATLRKVYSAAALGARYADREKRRPVLAHHYRAAVVAGVQPARSAVLLGDADGGTPQRWLWLPTNDPDMAEPAGTQPAGTQLTERQPPGGLWQQYEDLQAFGELSDKDIGEGLCVPVRPRVEFKVCDEARTVVVEHRRARLAAPLVGADDDLGGHALLTRLKIAALLALFDHGRAEIAEDDWHLSGVVMAVSDATREVCTQALAATARKVNVARAHQEAERLGIVADRTEQRVAAGVARVLRRSGDWMPRAELRRALRGPDREFFDTAVERLRHAGQIEEEVTERGVKYRTPVE